VSGLGKGVVGTVTKPVAGVLDFASGAASAIRDTSKSHIHRRPARVRRPRCCYGHGGLLAPYSGHSAEAQEELLRLNSHNYAERCVVPSVGSFWMLALVGVILIIYFFIYYLFYASARPIEALCIWIVCLSVCAYHIA